MKRYFGFFLLATLLFAGNFFFGQTVYAQENYKPPAGFPLVTPYVTPRPCISNYVLPDGSCPPGSRAEHFCPGLEQTNANNYPCASTYEEWLQDTTKNFWVYDPEVTALGKGGERSRQFLLWVLTHPSIDDHPVIMDVWQLSRNVALFFILLVTIILGLGIIIGQQNNFQLRIEIAPIIIKVGILLLYVALSARIVLFIIELADILMEFFIRNLGVMDLFNIYFVTNLREGGIIRESETAYRCFVGCSNWNTNNIEMVKTSKFLVRFTNMTYYFLGLMVIIRKVVLWFLTIVSPFLAILAPFIFIRNIGWIWIGVFFQWVFYGPLFALFLGALASIWNSVTHIPFIFDFSRTHKFSEAVYPTSINILYGGPAQKLGIWNTSNYVDTFAEYIISLVMLWTVIVLPWWLLRIFRDYCCDGIMAMKNILMAMYSAPATGGGGGGIGPIPTPKETGKAGIAMPLPTKAMQTSVTREREVHKIEERERVTHEIKIERVEDIERATTTQIMQSVSMQANRLTDIARFETNKEHSNIVKEHIEKLQNPLRADTATERQKYIAIRNTIADRAAKGDLQARAVMSVIGSSQIQKSVERDRILSSVPKVVPVIKTISIKFNLPEIKAKSIVKAVLEAVAVKDEIVRQIAQESGVSEEKAKTVIKSIAKEEHINKPVSEQIESVAKETNIEKEKVRTVVKHTAAVVKLQKDVKQKIAQIENISEKTVENVIDTSLPTVAEPEKHIENQVAVTPKVSIEEYEEVKNMWIDQYERGEVPVSDIISDRQSWVNAEIVSLTNVLNKLSSSDPKLQAEGLDEVGMTLPVFMVNNMSGEELVVYLKAKLEAAKQVAKQIEREEEIMQKAKEKEEFVEVEAPVKARAAKAEVLSEELPLGEDSRKNDTLGSEDYVKAEGNINAGISGDNTSKFESESEFDKTKKSNSEDEMQK